MIAVIADDITGAAEVAGIARRFGLRVCLSTAGSQLSSVNSHDVLVIATDTRSMTEEEAVAESRRVGRIVASMPDVTDIFKKTDSALRGHVVAELKALLAVTRYDSALYIPANPSKGRIINGGEYFIGEKPLHLTDFAFDPEFPAFSSRVAERLPGCADAGIMWADAESAADIEAAVDAAKSSTLLAGAADLFTAFLRRHFPDAHDSPAPEVTLDMSDIIVVCGSTQSRSEIIGTPVSYMPRDVYDGAPADGWIADTCKEYSRNHSITLAISYDHRTGHDAAAYLRGVTARTTHRLIEEHTPAWLVIEGGATAYAVISAIGWDVLEIDTEIAPGVICMKSSGGTYVILKPGSYPWGPLFAI